jgi:hypothetical protein
VLEIERMPAPRFYALAYRIGAYGGRIHAVQLERAHRTAVARAAAPVNLADWAAAHPDAMAKAYRNQQRGE